MSSRKFKLSGRGVAALRESLLALCESRRWPTLEPLPATRFLGGNFGISNVSAFRVLNELSDGGQLWRATNGRYFLPDARRLLEKPAPVACLIRRLERWTEVGREIMNGVDDACGDAERAMLLVHDRTLFRQTDPDAPTVIGSDAELRRTMEDFFRVHSERISGVILDELWPDRVLAGFKTELSAGVVVYRHTTLPFLGSVSADVGSAAKLVVDHARRNGFAKIILLQTIRGYQPSDEITLALRTAVKGNAPHLELRPLDSSAAIQSLLMGLRKERRKTLLVVTEDNAAVAVLQACRHGGITIPERVGLMTTMGSKIALDRSITSTKFDFRLMGAEAARMAISGTCQKIQLAATFFPGESA